MSDSNKTDVVTKLAELQNLFYEQLLFKINGIEKLWKSAEKDSNKKLLSELHRIFHSIAGTAGTYGAFAVSSASKELERLFFDFIKNSNKDCINNQTVNGLILQLRQAVDDWRPTDISRVAAMDEPDNTNNKSNNNNLIYLVEDDELLAVELCLKLDDSGYRVRHFKNLSEFESNYDNATPEVIIMDIFFEGSNDTGIEVINKFKLAKKILPPVIFISAFDGMQARLEAARLGAHRYFSKPLDINKLVNTLDVIVNESELKPYKILIVDDDEALLSFYKTVLISSGMEVDILSNPLKCLDKLIEFKPDIIVLDVYMPECSGPELATVIRQDDFWALTPIMFLSNESSLELQLDAMSYGGDDFLVKPVTAQHLISAVQIRAKRARLTNKLNYDLEASVREVHFQIATMNQHDIVSTTDVAGKIITVNDKFCKISGYNRYELLGNNHRILKSGKHPSLFYDDMWKTISNGKIWHGEICNRKKDGNEYWVEATIVPFLDEKGKPYKYVSARTDITPLRQSEDRLIQSQLFANIGTWDWDIITGAFYWSERIWTLFGYDKAKVKITYNNFINAIHPEDRDYAVKAINDCIEYGENFNIEHRVIWPDGSVHWLHESGDVVRCDVDADALHMLGVVQDITIRKYAQINLNETEERNRLLLESVGEGIFGIDLKGNATFVNPVFCDMLGFTPEEVIGNQVHPLIHHSYSDGNFYPHQECPTYAALTDGKIRNVRDEYFWHKDGSRIPVEYTSTPILKNSELIGVVTIFQNISNRLKFENELINAKEQAETANRTKSQFLSSMSHELRTPMNAIMGFGQLLSMDSDHPLASSQQENVDEIMNAAAHLLELINEILDLAKIESGQLKLSIESIMLSDVVSESIQLIIPQAQEKNIDISLFLDGSKISLEQMQEKNQAVLADHVRLKQVLLNLLSNAVKYNINNGIIEIRCEHLNDRIKISIVDSGDGISDEHQLKLFVPFERLGAENSDKEGAGIGLYITKSFTERMGGSIGVKSKLGKGSTFWVDFPRDNVVLEYETIPHAPDILSNQAIAKSDRKYTVLYIEDNPANLRLVFQLLNRLPNMKMLSAQEPLSGLDIAINSCPDLILLDINLPVIDGFEVLKRLKKNSATNKIPVVAISANAMESDIKQGLDAGFYDYLTKPINVSILLKVVDNLLSKLI